MRKLYVDIETYSSTDLRAAGVYRYREDPTFQVLMGAWSVDRGPVHLALGDAVLRIPGLLDPAVTKVAHNAAFERVCLNPRRGAIPHWDDTQARAAEHGYPQSLGKLAVALGAEEKDEAGTRLINLFCRPNKHGARNLPEDYPEQWEEFKRYCIQDVATLVDIDSKLPDWPTETERQVYFMDQVINDRGVKVDLELAEAAVAAAEDNQMTNELEIMALTGIDNPASTQQLLRWLDGAVPNLKAETVQAALNGELAPDVRRVLELRQDLAFTASKKYLAVLEGAGVDGRLRGGFRFFGAHTGRWAGRGVQLHNLPRASLESDSETEAAIFDLKAGLGAPAYTLKALVRPTLVGPLTVVDYAAIEARVVAWLAGEQWALDAFRAGRDIYVETAERMGGLTRAQGKIAVLALGYNGAVGSLRAMGGDNIGSESALVAMVQQWRKANPNIVRLWRSLEQAFRLGGPAGAHLKVRGKGSTRQVVLPSGRAITYRGCRFGERMAFKDPKYGMLTDTYGGRLVENATQAVARDILAEALVRLEKRGYRVVGHVHDEILVEGEHDVHEVAAIMSEPPAWAAGLPISGEGYTCARYKKG